MFIWVPIKLVSWVDRGSRAFRDTKIVTVTELLKALSS